MPNCSKGAYHRLGPWTIVFTLRKASFCAAAIITGSVAVLIPTSSSSYARSPSFSFSQSSSFLGSKPLNLSHNLILSDLAFSSSIAPAAPSLENADSDASRSWNGSSSCLWKRMRLNQMRTTVTVRGRATAQYIQKFVEMRLWPGDACQLNIPMENNDCIELSDCIRWRCSVD
jgi:hypothetical protein